MSAASEPVPAPAPTALVPEPAWFDQRPMLRMSFTRLSTYRRCPSWYRFQYLDWHRSWEVPAQRAGHVVQSVLQRLFDIEAGADVTLETLEKRAFARARTLFAREWADARQRFEADPNGLGPWDLSAERYERYVLQGLRFHLQEVRSRIAGRHPRTGATLDLPLPIGVSAAWREVRPWHAPPAGEQGSDLEAIPGKWFQGQYDLVYSWTGRRRIIDLKASSGNGPFGTEIGGQLLSYAWMERELGRGTPEGLEGWFLGREEPLVLETPNPEALDAFEREARALLRRSGHDQDGGRDRVLEGFDPAPAQIAGFEARAGEPSAWCAFCPAAFTCEKTREARRAPEPGEGLRLDQDLPGAGRPVDLEGLVIGVSAPRADDRGKITRRLTIASGSAVRSFRWSEREMSGLVAAGLRVGRAVRLVGLRPWQSPDGQRRNVYPHGGTRVEVIQDRWPGFVGLVGE